MNEKAAYEAYRVRQFSGPHPAVLAAHRPVPAPTLPSNEGYHGAANMPAGLHGAPSSNAEQIKPDTGRVVVHFDVDAFYAQVEEVRNPALKERPMGVTQKYLIVTCNYPARARGVRKLMGIQDAQRLCPELVLVNGEDLSPYRTASKSLLAVLQRFGVAEKLGMDEVMVDVSAEVEARIARGAFRPGWHGHLHTSEVQLVQDSKWRPMDLRVSRATASTAQAGSSSLASASALLTARSTDSLRTRNSGVSSASGAEEGSLGERVGTGPEALAQVEGSMGLGTGVGAAGSTTAAWELRLMVGSAIAQEARSAVKAEAGFRSSAGIACNKMLAKLVSGLHKPDDQTILPPPAAAAFVAPLPVRAIPGVGFKLNAELRELGYETVAQLRSAARGTLIARFGDRVGSFLFMACRGQDPSPVVARGPPKSITVEDSFKGCGSRGAAEAVLRVLAPDLLARLAEEWQESGRRAGSMSLKWRAGGRGLARTSASGPMPGALRPDQPANQVQVDALVKVAMALLNRHLQEPFNLTLLNLGATNFTSSASGGGGPGSVAPSLQRLLRRNRPPAAAVSVPVSGSAPRPPSPQDSKTVAAASVHLRRDYGTSPQRATLLSKSAERALREGGGAPSAAAQPAPPPATDRGPVDMPGSGPAPPSATDRGPPGSHESGSIGGPAPVPATSRDMADMQRSSSLNVAPSSHAAALDPAHAEGTQHRGSLGFHAPALATTTAADLPQQAAPSQLRAAASECRASGPLPEESGLEQKPQMAEADATGYCTDEDMGLSDDMEGYGFDDDDIEDGEGPWGEDLEAAADEAWLSEGRDPELIVGRAGSTDDPSSEPELCGQAYDRAGVASIGPPPLPQAALAAFETLDPAAPGQQPCPQMGQPCAHPGPRASVSDQPARISHAPELNAMAPAREQPCAGMGQSPGDTGALAAGSISHPADIENSGARADPCYPPSAGGRCGEATDELGGGSRQQAGDAMAGPLLRSRQEARGGSQGDCRNCGMNSSGQAAGELAGEMLPTAEDYHGRQEAAETTAEMLPSDDYGYAREAGAAEGGTLPVGEIAARRDARGAAAVEALLSGASQLALARLVKTAGAALSDRERLDLALAARLQQEELRRGHLSPAPTNAATGMAGLKGGGRTAGRTAGGRGRAAAAKRQKCGSGPLDVYFRGGRERVANQER